MKRWIILLAALWLALAGWALAEIISIEQLNRKGISVGTETGCAAWDVIREKLPAARLEPYNDKQLGYVDVAAGRLDAFIFERTQMELVIRNGVRGVHLLDEDLGDAIKVAVGLSPVSSIPDLENRINAFIAGLRADGTLQDMITRWVTEGREDLPEISLPKKPALHLRVGTSGIVPLYSYYVGTELRGFDIELANRFAAYLGADLEFKVYDYGAIVPAAISGDVDCIMANLNVTPERAEALAFSDALYEIHIGVMVRGKATSVPSRLSAPSAPSVPSAPSAPKRTFSHVGVQTGTNFDAGSAKSHCCTDTDPETDSASVKSEYQTGR